LVCFRETTSTEAKIETTQSQIGATVIAGLEVIDTKMELVKEEPEKKWDTEH
jgi:hypothetical protein